MANYPLSTPTKPPNIAGGQFVYATHVGPVWDEVIAMVNTWGLNPLSLNAGVDANTLLNTAPASVAVLLDYILSMLKYITGGSWNVPPVADLTDVYDSQIVTKRDDKTRLPNSSPISEIISTGLYANRPTGGSQPVAGCLYYASDRKTVYRSDGATWVAVSIYPNVLTDKGLLYYNTTTNTIESVPAPEFGGVLGYNGGFIWTGLPAEYRLLQSPSIYRPTTRGFQFFSTIQECITASQTYDIIVVPPGQYTESLDINTRISIIELVPGTVVLQGPIAIHRTSVLIKLDTFTVTLGANESAITIDGPDFVYANARIIFNYVSVSGSGPGTLLNITAPNSILTELDFNNFYYAVGDFTEIKTFSEPPNGSPKINYKIKGLGESNCVTGHKFLDATGGANSIINISGGGKYSLYPGDVMTNVLNGSIINIQNVFFPESSALNNMLFVTGDRISHQDAAGIGGLMYAFNNYR